MKILHVPYTYAPDPLGGTEHYVRALAEQLQAHGCTSTIAAPGPTPCRSWQGGLEAFRFAGGQAPEAAQGVSDPIAAAGFQRILSEVQPQIVHLHARTAAVSELLLQAARAAGARTVVTYHTPTLSCLRGTMMLNGASPCDGLLDTQRCTACVLRRHGLIEPLPPALARLPASLGRGLRRVGLQRGPWLALRMRQIVDDHIARTHHFLSLADRVIAPCQWVADLLLANGVPTERLRLCRQGLAHPLPAGDPPPPRDPGGPLRLGFFGRLDPTKGIDVLFEAIRRIPTAPLELTVYGVAQQGSDAFVQQLHAMADRDSRIHVLPALSADQVIPAMRQLDLVLVPSLWMETGPLVVLEAFAAGTPVVGSDLGGIAELVKSNVNGLLVPPGDSSIWASVLDSLATHPEKIELLEQSIDHPRSMLTVAAEMSAIYESLISLGI